MTVQYTLAAGEWHDCCFPIYNAYYNAVSMPHMKSAYSIRDPTLQMPLLMFTGSTIFRHFIQALVWNYAWENCNNYYYCTLVTLYELLVVNNWFIIMEGFVTTTSWAARIYFMLFWIIITVREANISYVYLIGEIVYSAVDCSQCIYCLYTGWVWAILHWSSKWTENW